MKRGMTWTFGLAALASASSLPAATFCAASVQQLADALSTAGFNGTADTIELVRGTYLLTSGLSVNLADKANLDILGGWAAGCGSRVVDPTNTVLDGQHQVPVLRIFPQGDATITVQGLTFRNGRATTSRGAGLQFYSYQGLTHHLVVDRNIFRDNEAVDTYGGGFDGGSSLGTCELTNNLFVGNRAFAGSAAEVVCNGPAALVANNTIVGNHDTAADASAFFVAGPHLMAVDNVSWGNDRADVRAFGGATFSHNAYGTAIAGTPAAGNLVGVDPQFRGASDYRLSGGSLLRDAGLAHERSGPGYTDLLGLPRTRGAAPDIGAYEADPCEAAQPAACLLADRFRVEVDWATAKASGDGQPVELTTDTAYFWFFSAANVEAVVKVLDGCGVNGHYWVFAGGLTNQGVTLRVTDTLSGETKAYSNPVGTAFRPLQDTTAFAGCH